MTAGFFILNAFCAKLKQFSHNNKCDSPNSTIFDRLTAKSEKSDKKKIAPYLDRRDRGLSSLYNLYSRRKDIVDNHSIGIIDAGVVATMNISMCHLFARGMPKSISHC